MASKEQNPNIVLPIENIDKKPITSTVDPTPKVNDSNNVPLSTFPISGTDLFRPFNHFPADFLQPPLMYPNTYPVYQTNFIRPTTYVFMPQMIVYPRGRSFYPYS